MDDYPISFLQNVSFAKTLILTQSRTVKTTLSRAIAYVEETLPSGEARMRELQSAADRALNSIGSREIQEWRLAYRPERMTVQTAVAVCFILHCAWEYEHSRQPRIRRRSSFTWREASKRLKHPLPFIQDVTELDLNEIPDICFRILQQDLDGWTAEDVKKYSEGAWAFRVWLDLALHHLERRSEDAMTRMIERSVLVDYIEEMKLTQKRIGFFWNGPMPPGMSIRLGVENCIRVPRWTLTLAFCF